MVWHSLEEAVQYVGAFCGLLALIQYARQGKLRRIWNWPMRVTTVCWLLFGLLGWFGAWMRNHSVVGSHFGDVLGTAAVIAFSLGMVSLSVFVAGFLITMLRDFRPENRPAPFAEAIDEVQNLLLKGHKAEAVGLYQKQNNVSTNKAEEATDAMGAALQAGLRV